MKCIPNILLIIIMLLLYSGFIYFDVINFFETHADKSLFMLYTIPLMVVLTLIMLQEFYRRQVTDKLDIKRFLLQVIAGGAVVPVLGMIIVPAALSLFSLKSVVLISVGACSGLIGGLGTKGLLECLLNKNRIKKSNQKPLKSN